MQHTEELGVMAGILVPIAFFAMIFGIVYLSKRERMAMIERGMDPRRYKQEVTTAPTYLKWGLLLIGAGFGLFAALFLSKFLFDHLDNGDNAALHFSLIAIFGGLGLYTSFLIEKKEIEKKASTKENTIIE